MVGNPMEPKACLAAYDAANDVYDLYSSSQGISHILSGLTTIFRLPESKFRPHARDVGGGFGIRSDAYVEYGAALLAARTLGRPLKWVSSRSETFLSDYHGRDVRLNGELALDRDWEIRRDPLPVGTATWGRTFRSRAHHQHDDDDGARGQRVPHPGALRAAQPRPHEHDADDGVSRRGRPNVSYLIERLVEQAARETGRDRVELRRLNLIPRDAFPYQTPTAVYDSGDPPGLLDLAVEQSEWKRFEERRAESKLSGKLRGSAARYSSSPRAAGRRRRKRWRSSSAIRATLRSTRWPVLRAGHETVFPEIVAQVLGMSAEKVTLHASDPDGPALTGNGTISSRSMVSHGGAMVFAAREVIRKGLDLAQRTWRWRLRTSSSRRGSTA
jgi:carbon-monoxide dehydrogenase large subunit